MINIILVRMYNIITIICTMNDKILSIGCLIKTPKYGSYFQMSINFEVMKKNFFFN